MTRRLRVKLSEAVDAYLKERADEVSKHTVEVDRLALIQMVQVIGDIPVHKVERGHLWGLIHGSEKGWKTARMNGDRTKPLASSTRTSRMGILTRFFRWCQDMNYELAEQFPMKNINKPTQDNLRPNGWKRFTIEEIEACFDKIEHPRDRMLVAFSALTGVRLNEVLNRKIKHFHLAEGYYQARLSKKRQDSQRVHDLPISAWLMQEIERWLAFYESKVGKLDPEMYLIPFVAGPRLIGRSTLEPTEDRIIDPFRPFVQPHPMFKKVLKTMGVEDSGEGSHTFRRSIARIVFQDYCNEQIGEDEALVKTKELLNHASIETTLGYIGTDGVRKELHDDIKNGKLPIWQARKAQDAGSNVVQFPKRRNVA